MTKTKNMLPQDMESPLQINVEQESEHIANKNRVYELIDIQQRSIRKLNIYKCITEIIQPLRNFPLMLVICMPVLMSAGSEGGCRFC